MKKISLLQYGVFIFLGFPWILGAFSYYYFGLACILALLILITNVWGMLVLGKAYYSFLKRVGSSFPPPVFFNRAERKLYLHGRSLLGFRLAYEMLKFIRS